MKQFAIIHCCYPNGYKYKNHAQKFMLPKKQKIRRVEVVAQWLKEKILLENCVFTNEKSWSLGGTDNW